MNHALTGESTTPVKHSHQVANDPICLGEREITHHFFTPSACSAEQRTPSPVCCFPVTPASTAHLISGNMIVSIEERSFHHSHKSSGKWVNGSCAIAPKHADTAFIQS